MVNARIHEMAEGRIWHHLGAEIVSAENGKAVIRLPVKEAFFQLHGYVHGGILATLADMAMAAAVNTTVSEHDYSVTAEMKINYLRPGKGVCLLAKGKVIKRGRTLSHCQAEVFDENDESICFAVSTFYMFQKRKEDHGDSEDVQ